MSLDKDKHQRDWRPKNSLPTKRSEINQVTGHYVVGHKEYRFKQIICIVIRLMRMHSCQLDFKTRGRIFRLVSHCTTCELVTFQYRNVK